MALRPNRRCRPHPLASALLLCVAALDCAPATAAAAAAAIELIADDAGAAAEAGGGAALYLEVALNGSETRRIAHFTERDGRLMVGSDSLRQLGFRLPAGTSASIDLDSLPGIVWRYDAERQHIAIDAPADLLDQPRTELNAPTAAIPQAQASPGALLNYDLYATRGDDEASGVSVFSELRVFGPLGVFSNSWLARAADSPGSPPHAQSQRLDTNWRRSFVDTASVLQVGDAITGSLGWSRATRIGGIQWRRDFALQPELITFPVPAFLGQAALPSTIDLYVNGLRQYSSEAPAGPFQLNAPPIVNGAGDAQIVVTDLLGRQSTYSFDFYTTNQLLRAGLSDWSLELGFVREGYGTRSFAYADDPVMSGVWRHGLNERLTVETHAEAGDGLANAGVGGVLQLGRAGMLSASHARSEGHGRSGSQTSLGYSWRNSWLNLAIDSTRSAGDFRDIASLAGPAPARRSDRALIGFSSRTLGSIGANYVQLDYAGEPRSRYASAFWFRSFGARLSLSASVNQNLDDDADRSAFLSLSMNFAGNTSANLSTRHDAQGNQSALEVNRPLSPDGGIGWRARVQDGAQRGGQAELGWRGERAQLTLGAQSLDGNAYGYAGVAGAFAWMDGHGYAARRIDDAFAVVATGVADVPVLLANRPIGRTDAHGNLLVTPLNAFQRNLLAIDPMQLPADTRIERVDSEVVPYDRSGVLVDFRVEPVQAASIVLHDEDGRVLPVGSTVQLEGNATAAIVGYDGIVYLEGLAARNVLSVRTPAGACRVRFDYHHQPDSVALLGPLVCRKE